MARGRFISKEITIDKKVNSLSSPWSMLAFTWLLTHADAYGRTYGDPAIVKATVFPRQHEITVEMMAEYLREWSEIGLIVLYEVEDETYLEFPNFGKHQVGLRPDKEGRSNIPQNPENCRSNSGVIPEQIGLSRIEVKDKVEGNGIEKNPATGAVFRAYESEIGLITPTIADKIGLAIEDYPLDWITEAIKEAVKNNVRKWSYVEAILKRWKVEGKSNGKRPAKVTSDDNERIAKEVMDEYLATQRR
jgi:DnaD/phage-associated family protein